MSYSIYWIAAHHHLDPFTEGYVGMSNQPAKRMKAHTTDTAEVGSKVVREYVGVNGLGSVKHEILGTCESYEEARHMEAAYRPVQNIGWNLAKGGGVTPDCTGREHSTKTKQKIAEGNLVTKSGRTYISHFKGVSDRWSDEQKLAIGSAQKGKTISQEHKEAAREKLLRDNSPLAVTLTIHNVHTGETLKFGSIGSAADTLGLPYSTVRSARQKKNLMSKTWEFID